MRGGGDTSSNSAIFDFLQNGTGPNKVQVRHFIRVLSGDVYAFCGQSLADTANEITTQTFINGQFQESSPATPSEFIDTQIYIRRQSQGDSPW